MSPKKIIAILLFAAGLGAISAFLLVGPGFVSRYLSPDGMLTDTGVATLSVYRLLVLGVGIVLVMLGVLFNLRSSDWLKSHFVDAVFLSVLAMFAIWFGRGFINFDIPPFEDAAMLMRYARHLGEGHGIVWNIGEHPVDGATDFLVVVINGLLVWMNIPVEIATRALGWAAHLGTLVIIYWANRGLFKAHYWVAVFSALYLAVGNGLYYVAAYFTTPVFAFAAALAWFFALRVMIDPAQNKRDVWAFALFGLVTGLVRPEGVILSGLMLTAIVWRIGWQRSLPVVKTFLLVFGIFGGAYFIWRWNYFGYPLPNPFYRKGGGSLYWDSLGISLTNAFQLTLPFFIVGMASLFTRGARYTASVLIVLMGFASAFLLLSNEMNFGARFQYVLLPLALMAWPPMGAAVLERLPAPWQTRKTLGFTVLLVGAFLSLWHIYALGANVTYPPDSRYDVAQYLSRYKDKGYTMAISEAGLLPFYSQWHAIDTWGLNDSWVTHQGLITPEYLDRFEPEIIMFRAKFSPLVPEITPTTPFQQMTLVLNHYAEERGYVLAASFGRDPYDTEYYYVKSEFPDSAEIINFIQSMDYYFQSYALATNYALEGK